jgi:hypothetical protein
MGWITSTRTIKVLIGVAAIVAVVGLNNQPGGSTPCTTISNYPNRSAVFECPPGLSTVWLRDTTAVPIWTTVTTDKQAEAWLTKPGDNETLKTLRKNLGAPVILGGNGYAFLAVSSGSGLVYVEAKTRYLLTVVWDAKSIK